MSFWFHLSLEDEEHWLRKICDEFIRNEIESWAFPVGIVNRRTEKTQQRNSSSKHHNACVQDRLKSTGNPGTVL